MAFGIDRKSGWHEWAALCMGVLLFFTPWFFQFAGPSVAAWNAWIGGGLVVALTIMALQRFAEWEEWMVGVLGIWLVLSPWLLGFAEMSAATWSAVVLGALIAISSGWRVFDLHGGGHHGRAL